MGRAAAVGGVRYAVGRSHHRNRYKISFLWKKRLNNCFSPGWPRRCRILCARPHSRAATVISATKANARRDQRRPRGSQPGCILDSGCEVPSRQARGTVTLFRIYRISYRHSSNPVADCDSAPFQGSVNLSSLLGLRASVSQRRRFRSNSCVRRQRRKPSIGSSGGATSTPARRRRGGGAVHVPGRAVRARARHRRPCVAFGRRPSLQRGIRRGIRCGVRIRVPVDVLARGLGGRQRRWG